ncbi:hypothetical protein LBMAG53_20840 [Planctomycetota bacterium]|nr:hypothetical protein LBMAG53_20840 [Planctomycetota bacterium]
MDLKRRLGLDPRGGNLRCGPDERAGLHRSIMIKLACLGLVEPAAVGLDDLSDLITTARSQARSLAGRLCPADARIQAFLDRTLSGSGGPVPKLPTSTLVLDHHGLSRELSLPEHGDQHHSPILSSWRLGNGVLHNPKNDRRTTQGSFHVAEGGLPVPHDKYSVPLAVFARLLAAAFAPPKELLRLPFSAGWPVPAELFLSLHLRPLVMPAVPGVIDERRMEIRVFAPGTLASNLDFLESVFGNAGDPNLPANDAGLDVEHWTGTTGCIILAPHLIGLRKRDLGLPHRDAATARQRAEGLCWASDDERYNGGNAFKITHRTADGVIVTLIADNYFGYGKKEVKTQISFTANLMGLAEEEHAGGALAFASYHLGERFVASGPITNDGHTMADTLRTLADAVEVRPEGHAVLKADSRVVMVPEDAEFDLATQTATWKRDGQSRTLRLRLDHSYLVPSGYKVRLARHPSAPSWRLIGTWAYGTACHKPCTVSGGGKSEISKSIADAVIHGPIIVADAERDFAMVQEILDGDYAHRLRPDLRPDYDHRHSRAVLSEERSLGSVIKMFTPSEEFTDEYNRWLERIPHHIWPLVFIVKRFWRVEWGRDWRSHFHVDRVNGRPGFQLKLGVRPLIGEYLRVGHESDGSGWRTFKLRQDFIPADKIQLEDDITASVVVPGSWIGADPGRSYKLVGNCEHRLFQRPDDAIHRGYDKQAERDMSAPGLFASNWQPLSPADANAEIDDVIRAEAYTPPMRQHLREAAAGTSFAVASALPRLVDGKPSKNPRYLQVRPDHADPAPKRIAEIGLRLFNRIGIDQPLHVPVDAVLAGRRNNPPEPGVKPLCVYNPLHYQELPELVMDWVASLTGKSPSTTGAGSEGALTKGPFNAVRATADLNAALVGMILTGHDAFSSAAGFVGPQVRYDHDISLLVPELWCRLKPAERSAATMIRHGHLERVEDMQLAGRAVRSSRLGWRITATFLHHFFGRIFDKGTAVFDPAVLRPELQDAAVFADGVDNIVEAQRGVAQSYLDDGSADDACPPLRALLHIMATGSYQGLNERSPELRAQFTRDALLASDWYQARIEHQQRLDIARWRRHAAYLETFLADQAQADEARRLDLPGRLAIARQRLADVESPAWRDRLRGTIGADPTLR